MSGADRGERGGRGEEPKKEASPFLVLGFFLVLIIIAMALVAVFIG